MGRLARAGALLCLLVAAASASRCYVGSLNTDAKNNVVRSHVYAEECSGLCVRRIAELSEGLTMHLLTCEDKLHTVGADDVCNDDLCNAIPDVTIVIQERQELPVADRTCFVGMTIGSLQLSGATEVCTEACGTVSTTVSGYNSTLFFCASYSLCDGLIDPNWTGGPQKCKTYGSITGCCCSDTSNCNAVGYPVSTPLPSPSTQYRPPIACYSGIHLGTALIKGGGYVACQGQCASVALQLGAGMDATVYTCDPSVVCDGLKLTNNCKNITGSNISGCCCNTNACIDPTQTPPRYPTGSNADLECYVGLHIKNLTSGSGLDMGSNMRCSGNMCARGKTVMNGYEVEAFMCASYPLCAAVDSVGRCSNTTLIPGLETCCCSDVANCNTLGADITPVPPTPTPPVTSEIACLEGIYINGHSISRRFVACSGECASITFASSLLGESYVGTLYTCDPATVCQGLGIQNKCTQIPGTPVSGCCCDSDLCIDPEKSRYPNGTSSLQCGVGVVAVGGGVNFTDVYSMDCPGMCASVETKISSLAIHGFFCAPRKLCSAVGSVGTCQAILGSPANVYACCCEDYNNCNTVRDNIQPLPYTAPTPARPPIACFSGIGLNDKVLGDYMSCSGDCALLSFNTTVGSANVLATIYSCDPIDACSKLKMRNHCRKGALLGVLSGCCCDWNDCLDLQKRTVKPHVITPNRQCFVGISYQGPNSNATLGGPMSCDGECGTLITSINGVTTYGYFCAPTRLCQDMDIFNACRPLKFQTAEQLSACCCTNGDNCNVANQNVPVPVPDPTVPTTRRTPITCYSGLSFALLGTVYNLTDEDRYVGCYGDCAQLTYGTIAFGVPINATVFSCDPVNLCSSLGLSNKCSVIESSNMANVSNMISGCCCDWNDCIDKRTLTLNPMPHKDDLSCFVGLELRKNPMSVNRTLVGQTLPCNGVCATVSTHFGGYDTRAFMCASQKLCDIFDPEGVCGHMNMDSAGDYLETCCCMTEDNCNLKQKHIPVPTAQPPLDNIPTIACYAGLALNGTVITPQNRFMACQGDCSMITYSSSYNGQQFSATMFSCDPVSVCKVFGVKNGCTNIANGADSNTTIYGCCCGWNDCIDTTNFGVKPVPHHHKDDLQCFVGMQIRTNPIQANSTKLIGQTMPCNGDCVAINTHVGKVDTWGFFCGTEALCDAFDPTRGCKMQNFDNADYLETCCCGDNDNCNLQQHNIPVPTAQPTSAPTMPLACYTGMSINGQLATAAGRYMACAGDCARITYSTTQGGVPYNVTMFSCDPTSLCNAFSLKNSCGQIAGTSNSTSISGCCCGWSDCIDTTSLQVKPLPQFRKDDLKCFVGVAIYSATGNNVTKVGSQMACNGECISAETTVNGYKTVGFICGSTATCDVVDPPRGCSTMFLKPTGYAKSCCCAAQDNCNSAYYGLDPGPLVNSSDPVLACYTGYAINGKPLTAADRYMACSGDCAQVTMKTGVGNSTYALSLFTCDPVSVCKTFGLNNNCAVIPSASPNSTISVSGCCCNFNDCIDPASLTVRTAPTPPTGGMSAGISFMLAVAISLLFALQ